MSCLKRYTIRKGFSLIELLIVILILSIVYFLGFEGVEIGKPKPKALTPLTLKSTITSSELFEGQATLLCINKCRSCYLRKDVTSAFEEYTGPIDLGEIEVYTLDRFDTLTQIEYGRYEDQKICLVMNFYTNGSATQMILKNDEGAYFLPAFFGEPQRFLSVEEAEEHWLRNSRTVSDSGAYY
ncbi:MAG TPA: prepilin-type N-terminal cleavage/methylation domain-containing protein [Sulfurovum sp.]|uniref:prepilin-type N-terminal cleavage/methylation domain-containing protein n=1 Tax=Sulfurovum sp. TaxID=1969726 RepID=UPI002F93FA18